MIIVLTNIREYVFSFFFFQAEDGIRYLVRSRGLGDVYKRQKQNHAIAGFIAAIVAMSFIIIFKVVAWTWFILILSLIHI